MSKQLGFLLSALLCLALWGSDGAQATPVGLSVSSLHVAPGGNLVVPIDLASTEPLTLLAFDFVYWPADELCSALVHPEGITLRGAGRAMVGAQEDTISCEQGRMIVALFDLLGRTVVGPGTGPIAEIDFGAVRPAAGGVIHIGLQDIRANNGPDLATVANLTPPGMCEWACPPDRPDSHECWWACRACEPGEACAAPPALTIGTGRPTAPPASGVRCCVAADPCRTVDTAEECEAEGGLSLGAGSCAPDSCPAVTSPPATGPAPCPAGATDESVRCRLGELIAMVRRAGTNGTRLLGPLLRAERRLGRAAELHASGRKAKARAFLRRAAGDLRVFRTRLRSRRVGRLVGVPAKAAMLSLSDPLRGDLQALVTSAR